VSVYEFLPYPGGCDCKKPATVAALGCQFKIESDSQRPTGGSGLQRSTMAALNEKLMEGSTNEIYLARYYSCLEQYCCLGSGNVSNPRCRKRHIRRCDRRR